MKSFHGMQSFHVVAAGGTATPWQTGPSRARACRAEAWIQVGREAGVHCHREQHGCIPFAELVPGTPTGGEPGWMRGSLDGAPR
jgi:hypothetical protein